jgi:asparagine synthase (glutamine-hydrolysing)
MVKSVRALAGSHAQHAIAALGPSDRWRKVAEATTRPTSPPSAFLVYRGLFTRKETERLLPDIEHFDAVQHVQSSAGHAAHDLTAWISKAELRTYTANQLLRDTDVMSMHHSVEVRTPLLDTALVEAVFGLPAQDRAARRGKRVLRSLVADRLPSLVLERRARQGFAFPMRTWLADAPEHLWQWDSALFEQLDRTAMDEVQQRFLSGRAHWSRVWALVALNAWSLQAAHA